MAREMGLGMGLRVNAAIATMPGLAWVLFCNAVGEGTCQSQGLG